MNKRKNNDYPTNPNSIDRDQQILHRLANIENKIDSLEQTNAFALRADAQIHSKTVKEIFKKGLRRSQVYLAANGQRSVQEIGNLLGMKIPNVSRELEVLKIEGLLEVIERDGGKILYGKKPIDRTIGISRFLMKEYGLDHNGTKNT
jgi:DNA-binding transcriptional ArsR family regulator